jgi:hypothetical protein
LARLAERLECQTPSRERDVDFADASRAKTSLFVVGVSVIASPIPFSNSSSSFWARYVRLCSFHPYLFAGFSQLKILRLPIAVGVRLSCGALQRCPVDLLYCVQWHLFLEWRLISNTIYKPIISSSEALAVDNLIDMNREAMALAAAWSGQALRVLERAIRGLPIL